MNSALSGALGTFASFFTATFLEAAPFLLLGALLSALMEALLSQSFLERRMLKSTAGQTLLGLFAGMLLPTCECGVAPVTRRLLRKGVPPATAIGYMLAAPVVNPVVLASTYIAFQGNLTMVLGRVGMVLLPAAVLASVAGRLDPALMLRKEKHASSAKPHHAPECGCGHDHARPRAFRLRAVLSHAASEFVDMARFLALGAAAAAAFKTFLPYEAIRFLESNLLLAVAGMMALAVVLSVCSEADAFVAASFSTLPQAAQLSFTAIGPMVDLKLIALYFAIFHKRMALALIVVPTFLVYILSLVMGLFLWGWG